MVSPSFAQQTYAQRAGNFSNAAAQQLLETIERKKSNLCVSVDVTKSADFISVIDAVGPYVSLIKVGYPSSCAYMRPHSPIKTHIDVLDDFTPPVVDALTSLSKKHDFLIFEDRKFADIG
jgi:orotidine-5'-phosphate decarboxylase